VIPRALPQQIISACLKKSAIWKSITTVTLTVNMRLLRGTSDAEIAETKLFSEFLRQIGLGTYTVNTAIDEDMIRLPEDMVIGYDGEPSVQKLVGFVYGDINRVCDKQAYLTGRAIVAPKNVDVEELNRRDTSQDARRVSDNIFIFR